MTVHEELRELRNIEYFLRDELFALTLPSDLPSEQVVRRERETRDWLVAVQKRLGTLRGVG